MKIISLITLLSFTLSLSFCTITSILPRNNTVYKFSEIEENRTLKYYQTQYKLNKSIYFTRENKDNSIIITPKEKIDSTNSTAVREPLDSLRLSPSGSQLSYRDKIYFPSLFETLCVNDKLHFYEIKLGLQSMTVPFKFRSSVGNDSINPPTVETNFNLGFTPGIKLSLNLISKNTNILSITSGPHFGIGTAGLKKENASKILSPRNHLIFSSGWYLIFGINNINLGLAIGKDSLIGNNSNKQWIYQRKRWLGIILALDIIKY